MTRVETGMKRPTHCQIRLLRVMTLRRTVHSLLWSHSQSSSGIPNNLSGKLSISVCYLLPYLLTIMILSNMRKGLRNKMS